jgi:hypothetical protein
MSKDVTIDITPDPSLIEDIGSASYTLYQAINELLANTFDARVYDKKNAPLPLLVDINVVRGKMVEISDNAKGMNRETFEHALTLGFKMDRLAVPTRTRKGMYGLGMKTAAASLGAVWEIWTRSKDDQFDYYAKFDLEEFKSRWKGGASEKWKLKISMLARAERSPLEGRESGTIIRVTHVRDAEPDLAVLEERVSSANRVEIDAMGDDVRINGRKIVTANPLIASESRKEISFTVKVGTKEYIATGWWGRLNKYNNDGSYGFNLYREKQLIETNVKQPFFNPHNTLSNFYGELHLDFVKANFHKKGFAADSPEYKALVAVISKTIMPPILSQIRKFKAGAGKRSAQVAGAQQGAATAVFTAPSDAPTPVEEPPVPATTASAAAGGTTTVVTQPPAPEVAKGDWKVVRFQDVEPFALTYELTSMSSDEVPWYMMPPDEEKTLIVKINIDSQLYKKTKDPEMFAMFAVADCLCSYLRRESRRKDIERELDDLRNRWLNRASQMKFTELQAQTN